MLRKRCWVGVVCLVVCSCAGVAQARCDRMVVSADPAYPPLHWYDGTTLQGASIEIAKRVLTDLKIDFEIRPAGPFPRVLHMAERGDIDMLATVKKTPEREAFLLYPNTPAFINPVAVFTSREHPVTYHERSDLEGLRGVMTRGNVFGGGLDEYINDKLSLQEGNRPEGNFSLLAMGRVDYFITGYYTGMAVILQRGDESRFVAQEPFLVQTPNYLALSRAGRCADKLDAIEARLAWLKKAGVLDDLVRASFQRWKARPLMVDH